MAAEADNPKTGLIAWVTALSLILIFVAFVSLQGLYNLWEKRHAMRADSGNLETPLVTYNKEQATRLTTLETAKKSTLDDARAGKGLAAPPPAKTAAPTK